MKTLTLALTAASLLLASAASARTINWGSSFNSNLFTSDGTTLLDNTFTFELGTFGSFVPDSSNLELWAANWKPFDRTIPGSTWTPGDAFSSSADLLSNGTSSATSPPVSLPTYTFAQGEQAYIWAYNTLVTGSGVAEWALVTNGNDGTPSDDWLMPSPADHSALPLDWRLPVASNVIFGGLNDVQGPGTGTPPSGPYDLQTHTVPVPEPSSALLIAAVGLASRLLRRSRR